MDGDRDLDFLVKNDFTKLPFEVQLKVKRDSRPTPKLNLTKGRADGKVRSFCEANYARNEWLTGSAQRCSRVVNVFYI